MTASQEHNAFSAFNNTGLCRRLSDTGFPTNTTGLKTLTTALNENPVAREY
jgi:hypothetical protein